MFFFKVAKCVASQKMDVFFASFVALTPKTIGYFALKVFEFIIGFITPNPKNACGCTTFFAPFEIV